MSATPSPINQHPTIRAISGATPIPQLDARSTALLVIDFQNEYFTGRMPIPAGDAAMRHAQRLIDWADAHAIPVVNVQHVAPAGSPLFALQGDAARFHPQMQPRSGDMIIRKENVSVFVGTDIHAQLQQRGISTLVITGLMTHACVAGAARDAAPLGYQVIVASDACATRSITRFNAETVDHDLLHRSALAEIEDTFGDVLATSEILGMTLATPETH